MNKKMFLEKSFVLMDELKKEIEKTASERNLDVQSSDLELVLNRIREMRKRVEKNDLPPPGQRYRQLTRLVMDQWPLGSSLGNKVMELEKMYCD